MELSRLHFLHPRRRLVVLGLLIAALLASAVAPAAEMGLHIDYTPPPDVDVAIPEGRPVGLNDLAVVIGNRDYSGPQVPAVDYAIADAEAVQRYLVRTLGFPYRNVKVLRNATKGQIESHLGGVGGAPGWLQANVTPATRRVFVYYAGHGAPNPDPQAKDYGQGYLLPADGVPDALAATGYPLRSLYDNLRRLEGPEAIVVLDACFSGATQDGLLFRHVSPPTLVSKETAADLPDGAVLTSSSGKETSTWYPKKGHGLFTYYFLRALQGAADANRDKVLTAGEVFDYIAEWVPRQARRLVSRTQTPGLQGRGDLVLGHLR